MIYLKYGLYTRDSMQVILDEAKQQQSNVIDPADMTSENYT
jgi:hypothetical protein